MKFKYNPNISVIIYGKYHISSNSCDKRSCFSPEEQHPPVDAVYSDSYVRLWMELPGVSEDDIDVYLHNDHLIIRGVKRTNYINNECAFLMIERCDAPFYRAFKLKSRVDESNVQAVLKDGILSISWKYTK